MDLFTRWLIITMLSVLVGCMIALTNRTIQWSADAKMARTYCGAIYYGIHPTPDKEANHE